MTFKLIEDRRTAGGRQAARDVRLGHRDGQDAAVTSGDAPVTGGASKRFPWRAWAGLCMFTAAICTVNAISIVDDIGPRMEPWKPFVWEWSSAIMTIGYLPLVSWLSRWAPPGRGRWARFALTHLAGSAAYCLVHVGGFVVLRKLAYANIGQMYDFGSWDRLFYEYRKDILTYAASLAAFLLADRLGRPVVSVEPLAAASGEPEAQFDIRDGARLIRVAVRQIVAVRGAGNYVEVQLADGRRPLMRATLSALEAELADHGFVRAHRSWLVNPACVRGLTPEGSGDYRVDLEGGAWAPVSRRFPEALQVLRGER